MELLPLPVLPSKTILIVVEVGVDFLPCETKGTEFNRVFRLRKGERKIYLTSSADGKLLSERRHVVPDHFHPQTEDRKILLSHLGAVTVGMS